MTTVDNKKTLFLLTRRFLRANRGRCVLCVLSIILTALLFTALFGGASSMFLTKLEADKKLYLTTAHATIQQLSDEEADAARKALSSCGFVKRFGADQYVGTAADERLSCSLELRFGDAASAENRLAAPTVGRMPEAADEIAVSTQILDSLGVSRELGSEVTLSVGVGRHAISKTFHLCGVWQGDSSDLWQFGWVSADCAAELLGSAAQDTEDAFSGTWTFCVWFDNVWKLEKYARNLSALCSLETAGRSGSGFRVNPAYEIAFAFREGSVPPLSVALLALLIFLAGYLIIYNIFSISVKSDIRAYGLLKNVGTTDRQLKAIVRMQALFLCAIGIPIGLPLGYLANRVLAPALNANLSGETVPAVSAVHPLLFAAAALFALATVYLSSMQACRIVQRLTPVDALRMADAEPKTRALRLHLPVSSLGLAIQNTYRNRRRGVIVVLSIALSLSTLFYVSIVCRSMDFKEYAGLYLDADFELDKLPSNGSYANFHSITPEIQNILDVCPYAKSIGYIYLSDAAIPMSDGLRAVFEKLAEAHLAEWDPYFKDVWEKAKSANRLPVYYMGITEAIFDKLAWPGEPCSWAQFRSGNYALIRGPQRYQNEVGSYLAKDEAFTVEFADGTSRGYTVLAEVGVPYNFNYPYSYLTGLEVLVPAEEYIERTNDFCAMKAAVDAIPGQEKLLNRYLDDTVLSMDSSFLVSSVLKLKKTYDNYINRYYLVGGLLCAVLAFIGIMNFFNTSAATVLSRRREFALLEAVGMTTGQLKTMLVAEGCIDLGCALLAALALTYGYCGHTMHLSPADLIGRTALPCLCTLPVLFLVAWKIPETQFRRMERQSLTERLRE